MGKFEIPSSIKDLDLEKLAELEAKAVEAFDELRDDPDLDAEGMKELKALAAFIKEVRARQTEIAEQTKKDADELAALTAEVHPDDGEGDEGEDGGGGDDGGETVETAETEEKVPVLADGIRRQATGGRRRGPGQPPASHDKAMVVRAAAGFGKIEAGAPLDSLAALSDAFAQRLKNFPGGGHSTGRRTAGMRTRLKHEVATFERPLEGQPIIADGANFWKVLEQVGDERKLRGGNLIAAGGWCAPNLQVWELCPGLETAAGIAQFPSFRLQRGGIQYPANLEFRDIYAAAGLDFHQTEADSIAGTDKVCYDIPCPTFEQARLEIDGICFKQDIVQNAVWPEVTQDIIRRAMIAHEHKINARLLAQVFAIAATGSVAFTLALGSDIDGDKTTTGVLGALSLAAVDYRYRYRMDPKATIEGFAPYWLLDWIRTDMSRRAGVTYFEVTDEQINRWLAVRNIRLQWVYDLQDGYVNGGGAGFGGTVPPQQWPAQVQIALHAAGTFTKGSNGIIELAAVYDSTSLKDNEYTAAFTEESTLLLRRCQVSYLVTIPLCPTGVTGTTQTFDCVAA